MGLEPGIGNRQSGIARGVTPTDKIFLAYLALNTLILFWKSGEVPGWLWLLAGNALGVALVMLLARAPKSRVVTFIGGAYPIILTAAFYTQLGVIHLNVGTLYDGVVQRWEEALFGSQLAVTWHQRMPSYLLSLILHFCYGSYYWILVLPLLYLYVRGTPESFERAGFIMTLGFYACYLIFAVFPVAGPRYFYGIATGPIAEVPTARLVNWITEGGSAIGTAFPSSHVAATWCAVYALWRDARRLALVIAPVALGLALGTVYGQFHYAIDAVVGAILGILLCAAADPVRRRLTDKAPGASF